MVRYDNPVLLSAWVCILISSQGPAKVSTMRGKYKQIFLRVSAAGELDCKPTNIKVNPDRTMDIIIEDVGTHSWKSASR